MIGAILYQKAQLVKERNPLQLWWELVSMFLEAMKAGRER
jgi:hypothetical protein